MLTIDLYTELTSVYLLNVSIAVVSTPIVIYPINPLDKSSSSTGTTDTTGLYPPSISSGYTVSSAFVVRLICV